jgi:hypothetical protein
LVECQLPKLDVAGSNPVLRSIISPKHSMTVDLRPRISGAKSEGRGAAQNKVGWSGPIRR